MRTSICFGVACGIVTAAIGACSSSGSGSAGTQAAGDTGTGGTVSTSSTGATTSTHGATGTGGASTTASSATSTAASTGSGSTKINGCDPAMATDLTAMTAVTLNFGGITLGAKYDQPCIKVAKGTMVTFAGSFLNHPLAGGNMPPAVDATSPIAVTTTGTSATFTLGTAGAFGYFCQMHYGSGMEGAIVVQ